MQPWRLATLFAGALLLLAGCGGVSNADHKATGNWTLLEADIDGVPEEHLSDLGGRFLAVDGNSYQAETQCGGVSGVWGGEAFGHGVCMRSDGFDVTEMIDEPLGRAIAKGPTVKDSQLVFSSSGVRLVYEAFELPPTPDLLADLFDPALALADPSVYLGPEGGTLQFDVLVERPHSETRADFYAGLDGESICFTHTEEFEGGSACLAPRDFARKAYIRPLANQFGDIGISAGLLPDLVIDAPELANLGELQNNILVIEAPVKRRTIQLTTTTGEPFSLIIR